MRETKFQYWGHLCAGRCCAQTDWRTHPDRLLLWCCRRPAAAWPLLSVWRLCPSVAGPVAPSERASARASERRARGAPRSRSHSPSGGQPRRMNARRGKAPDERTRVDGARSVGTWPARGLRRRAAGDSPVGDRACKSRRQRNHALPNLAFFPHLLKLRSGDVRTNPPLQACRVADLNYSPFAKVVPRQLHE
jgi:hypothetical protein